MRARGDMRVRDNGNVQVRLKRSSVRHLFCGLALHVVIACNALAAELPSARPEAVGFSSERLRQLPAALRDVVDNGELAGFVTLVARHGKVVQFESYGASEIAAQRPMRLDTIFRIYSMTKPITGVAMMMLYEQGKWHPDDPLSRHIPEFANLMVYAGTDDAGNVVLERPKHPPTVGELMTHTAGFTYGFFGQSPVDRLYQERNPLAEPDLQAFIERLAEIPLAYQPGEQWLYSVSVDIQGYLIEKLSGQSLSAFLRSRIFAPLDMHDTDFAVPPGKLSRLATVYGYTADMGLTPIPHDPNVGRMPGLPSGGGGLYSTTRDYARFAQMLANAGVLDGKRLLAPSTIALMRSNHLSDALLSGGFGIGFQQLRPGFGFGYDVAVFEDPQRVGSTTGQGTYLWDGAAGTWFWIDPTNDIVFVGMIQRMMSAGGMPNIQNLSRALVHQALVDP
jgi:CubicO group peptidase (beta-lactamase class C family)